MPNYEKSTKHKFIVEALRLFSEKGYEAVPVQDIANAVGCSAPALYKHYKSKRDLLDAIITESERGFSSNMKDKKIDLESNPKIREAVLNMTEEEEIEKVKDVIRYALHNEFTQAFRKLCVVEQYHMKDLSERYSYRYIDFQFAQYEEMFKLWIKEGRIKPGDPKAMATLYMSYPILAIGICDIDPNKEAACMVRIENHIREFNKQFRIK